MEGTHVFHMGSTWVPHGFHMGSTWVPHGFHVCQERRVRVLFRVIISHRIPRDKNIETKQYRVYRRLFSPFRPLNRRPGQPLFNSVKHPIQHKFRVYSTTAWSATINLVQPLYSTIVQPYPTPVQLIYIQPTVQFLFNSFLTHVQPYPTRVQPLFNPYSTHSQPKFSPIQPLFNPIQPIFHP